MSDAAPTAASPTASHAGLSGGMVTLFAVAAGLGVANIYYSQPLLAAIARTFRTDSATASIVAVAGTLCYAVGLGLIVPLGDIKDRRKLVVILVLAVAAGQAVSAVAPTISVLVIVAGAMSLTAVVAPLLVAFAASLASPQARGSITGQVMSGVLMGVLLARIGGGLLAQWSGSWRVVYGTAAVLMLVLAVVLWRKLPQVAPAAHLPYRQLIGSVVTIVRQEPVLRLRCLYGFITFAGFNILWTSVAFLLSRPPYSYGEAVIGLVGVAGVVGAMAARFAGPLVDRGKDHAATGILLTIILASWVLLGLAGGRWLVALLLGVALLDVGVQGMQVVNLGVNFRLRPEARSRITTAYMVTYFSGAAAGSAASAGAYAAGGWGTVSLVGAALAALTLLLWGREAAGRLRAGG
jgi:predicted MFS family arabinose efflux permease